MQTEARELLAEIYTWFREGFDTKDLQGAKVLLEELRYHPLRFGLTPIFLSAFTTHLFASQMSAYAQFYRLQSTADPTLSIQLARRPFPYADPNRS